jgi:hypothetical protein
MGVGGRFLTATSPENGEVGLSLSKKYVRMP